MEPSLRNLTGMALFQSHSYLVPWRLSRVSPAAPVVPVPRAGARSSRSEVLAVGTVSLATASSFRKRRGRWLVTLN